MITFICNNICLTIYIIGCVCALLLILYHYNKNGKLTIKEFMDNSEFLLPFIAGSWISIIMFVFDKD